MTMLALLLCFALPPQEISEKALRTEVERLDAREAKLRALQTTAPERFVAESLRLAEDYMRVGETYRAVRQSVGARGKAFTLARTAAMFARFKLRNPKNAIELCRRAAEFMTSDNPKAGPHALDEEVADIYQFDLHDYAAAIQSLNAMRPLYSKADGGEFAQWYAWKSKWLDAETAFLKTGKRFAGSLSGDEAAGFIGQIYFTSAGLGELGLDPALNPYNATTTTLTPAEIETKLAALLPSHSTFQMTWIFATHLPPAAARKWLDRNDPGGYWSASLLTLAAMADQKAGTTYVGSDPLSMIVRTPEGKPTGLALLAREYAKTHVVPK
jgi:hypothetical protein